MRSFFEEVYQLANFKKVGNSSWIESRLSTVGSFCYLVAASYLLGCFFLHWTFLSDAVVFLVLGYSLVRFKSRIVSILLFFLGLLSLWGSLQYFRGSYFHQGLNLFFPMGLIFLSLRSIQLTWIYHREHRPKIKSRKEPIQASSVLPVVSHEDLKDVSVEYLRFLKRYPLGRLAMPESDLPYPKELIRKSLGDIYAKNLHLENERRQVEAALSLLAQFVSDDEARIIQKQVDAADKAEWNQKNSEEIDSILNGIQEMREAYLQGLEIYRPQQTPAAAKVAR